MNSLAKYLLLFAVCVAVIIFTVELAFAADPGDDTVDCDVTVTVNQIIEWESDADMTTIALAQINAQGDTPEGSSTYTLWINCDVSLTANNTASGPAELSSATTVLITKYKIAYDDTGGTTGADTAYEDYSTFIDGAGSAVTHVDGDGAVEVTLWAQASNDSTGHKEVSDAGAYTATQTLTASWTGD